MSNTTNAQTRAATCTRRGEYTTTTPDEGPCFLLRLPTELRFVIYKFALSEDDYFGREPDLTRVNKEITAKAPPIFYNTSTFTLKPHTGGVCQRVKGLKLMGLKHTDG